MANSDGFSKHDLYGAELLGERSKNAAGGLAPVQQKHKGFASKLGFVLAAA